MRYQQLQGIVAGMSMEVANVMSEYNADLAASRLITETLRVKKLRELVEAAAADRRETILALRRRGWTVTRIGDAMGISHQSVSEMIRKAEKEN